MILCLVKMNNVPIVHQSVKGRAAVKVARVVAAVVAVAVKADAATRAAVRAVVVAEEGTQVPARRHHQHPDSPSASTGKEVRNMSGFDGTGPNFAGPMTGGARGYCYQDAPAPGIRFGRGPGVGRGLGGRQRRGRGSWPGMGLGRSTGRHWATLDPVADRATMIRQLDQQAQFVQQHLDTLNARIESLKADATQDA